MSTYASSSTLIRAAVGEQVRWMRQQQGLTLRDLSGRAAVSAGYLSEVELGKKEPSSEVLSSLCSALNVDVPDMLEEVARLMRGRAGTARAAA